MATQGVERSSDLVSKAGGGFLQQGEPIQSPGSLLQRQQHCASSALVLSGREGLAQPVVASGQLAKFRGPDFRGGGCAVCATMRASHRPTDFGEWTSHPAGGQYRNAER